MKQEVIVTLQCPVWPKFHMFARGPGLGTSTCHLGVIVLSLLHLLATGSEPSVTVIVSFT